MNDVIVRVAVTNVTDEQAIKIKQAIEDAVKTFKTAEVDVSIRKSRTGRGG